MASKSKRRRRVFRASCILAALIIAGSSFAWFTSKDEVTNRLNASADYNVVAIENFVPPKQFVPGQTVTKEEAVTNTGNIDAFVKQTITADAKVSVEVPTTIAPDAATDPKDYLKLEEQVDWGSLEAGSVLAWAPTGSAYKGQIIDFGIDGKVVVKDPDTNAVISDNHDFDPDVTGLYIFRRAIVKKGGTGDDQNEVKNYEYVGYYFVKGNGTTTEDTYYKIYSLNVTNDMLDTDTDGLLKSAPTVTYSKKIITDKVKVDMYYLEPNDEIVGYEEDGTTPIYNTDYRLKYVFNGQNVIDQAAAAAAAAVNNTAVYTNYQQYLDYLQGKTTYVPTDPWTQGDGAVAGTDDLRALDDSNKTGLNNYDIYDQDAANYNTETRKTDLSNFSYNRLEDLKYGTNYNMADYGNAATDGNASADKKAAAQFGLQGLYNFASPKMSDYTGVTTVDGAWDKAYEEAYTSRQTINTGINASKDLAEYKTAVETAIGRADADATGNSGLRLVRDNTDTNKTPVGKNQWAADMIYIPDANGDNTITAATPTVAFDEGAALDKINFATTSAGLTGDAVTYTMTADNVLEKRFRDNATAFGTASADGSQVKFKTVTNPYQSNTGTLATTWDAYVQATKRMALVDKKIELVNAARGNGGVATDPAHATETNVVRTVEEADRVLAILKAEKATIQTALDDAKTAYDNAVADVATNIGKMNKLQALVDAANLEYKEYFEDDTNVDFVYDPEASTTLAAKDAIVTKVTKGTKTNEGEDDSPAEDKFEACLNAAYGTAHRDTAATMTANYPATYTCDHNPVVAGHNAGTYPTYSKSVTEADIRGATTYNNTGTSADGTAAIAATSALPSSELDDVKAAPYWRLLQVDNMRTFIKGKSTDYYNDYKTAADALALNKTESEQSTDPVVVYIGLGDIGSDLKADGTGMWQYVGDATEAKAANQFDFGYTRVVGAGETSNKLIEYVKFADSVTQDSFLDMVFDINVGVESAQVVYNGDRVGAQAAQASLSPIIPTQAEYNNSNEKVNWAARTNAANPAITDEDPNPKADAPTP